MWGLTQNEYGVLSTYVPRFEEMGLNTNERWEVCTCRWAEEMQDSRPRPRRVHYLGSFLLHSLFHSPLLFSYVLVQVPHICRAFFTPGDAMPRNEQAKAAMWLTRYVRRERRREEGWEGGQKTNACQP
jgi:hypothetical protein